MATIADFFKWKCPPELAEIAGRNAVVRISNGEYARDCRLNDEQRTSKITIGYIGEFGFRQWCRQNKIDAEYLGKDLGTGPDHGDFRLRNGMIVDVKTQESPFEPRVDWRCEVTGEQMHRPADVYVFCKLRVVAAIYTLFIVGWQYKKDFKQKALYHKQGDILRGKPVHYPKYDMTIAELRPMGELKTKN
jgi:hypothetical protein